MDRKRRSQRHFRRSEFWLTVFGVVGMIAVAVFSNWSDIFPGRDGYRPTDDFETELRTFYNLSRRGRALEKILSKTIDTYKEKIGQNNPEMRDKIEESIESVKSILNADQIFSILLPIYRNNFDISQIQKLNTLYSDENMQEFVSTHELVIEEAVSELVLQLVENLNNMLLANQPQQDEIMNEVVRQLLRLQK